VKIAPVALFVYNRPDHTRMTIEALLKNDLSDQTAVYIYSDAARNESDIPRVNEVRHYLHHLRGFSRINVIERTENWGLAKSIISGVSDLAKEYGTVIVLEDDIVTSPYFFDL
jgi:GT2 family glycosyltransferase